MNKAKNVLVCAICGIITLALSVAGLFFPDEALSMLERRKLTQVPELSTEALLDGSFAQDAESYLLDQFPWRNSFLKLNAGVRYDLLGALDMDGAFELDGGAYLIEYPLDEKQAAYAASRMQAVYEKYLTGINTYLSIIPDKSYFVAEKNGYPHLDYDKLVAITREEFAQAQYIDIFGELDISDYYRTDPHWRQPELGGVVDALMQGMGSDYRFDAGDYDAVSVEPFYGSYYARTGMNTQPDTITYLTNAALEGAQVTYLGSDSLSGIYAPGKISGTDGYDLFLNGAQSLITITNPQATTDRELVIFRDSFGSSLAPLLAGAYSKIIIADIRYVSPDILGDYVDFSTVTDALFIYNTTLINGGGVLR